MSSIGVYSNTDKCDERRENDFYETPWEATEALLLKEREYLLPYRNLWEPACGKGAISNMLKLHGYDVVSSDLIDRGYGICPVDFLADTLPMASAIITNPPFDRAEEFIRQTAELGTDYFAFLLKANYFHADCRVALYNEITPSRIYPMAWRLDFTGGGANHFDCIWVVWDVRTRGKVCHYMPPLEKPTIMGQRAMI